jgi:hypothetical protein
LRSHFLDETQHTFWAARSATLCSGADPDDRRSNPPRRASRHGHCRSCDWRTHSRRERSSSRRQKKARTWRAAGKETEGHAGNPQVVL